MYLPLLLMAACHLHGARWVGCVHGSAAKPGTTKLMSLPRLWPHKLI